MGCLVIVVLLMFRLSVFERVVLEAFLFRLVTSSKNAPSSDARSP